MSSLVNGSTLSGFEVFCGSKLWVSVTDVCTLEERVNVSHCRSSCCGVLLLLGSIHRFIPRRKIRIHFFPCFDGGKVPYNASNTARFFLNVVQKQFKGLVVFFLRDSNLNLFMKSSAHSPRIYTFYSMSHLLPIRKIFFATQL